MKRYPGVVIGTVKSLEDPDGEGRIQVVFPWLDEREPSGLAPIATLMAGHDRGAYFMPEIGDEVLVAFEHGDFDHPFVVGFLWNGAQRPPHSDINPSVRRLRTVSGHRLDFNDNGGQEEVVLVTSSGHRIEMKDSSPASVTITTAGGQEVKLNDATPEVSVKTTAGNQIKVSDSPPGITLSVPTGTINVNCRQANLTSTAALYVTAPMTVFPNLVRVNSLVADSVVSNAYNTAAGNIFGL